MKRVVIAAETLLLRHTMRAMLEKEDDFYVIGSVSDDSNLRFLLSQCDLALISATLQGDETVALFRDLRALCEEVTLIAVGVSDAPAQIMRFLEAGAGGYVLNSDVSDALVNKVRATMQGRALVSPEMAAVMMAHINNLANAVPSTIEQKKQRLSALTPRQLEVLELVSEGLTNQQIASELFIECGTVKNHVHHILKKIDANDRYEAATIYQQARKISTFSPVSAD